MIFRFEATKVFLWKHLNNTIVIQFRFKTSLCIALHCFMLCILFPIFYLFLTSSRLVVNLLGGFAIVKNDSIVKMSNFIEILLFKNWDKVKILTWSDNSSAQYTMLDWVVFDVFQWETFTLQSDTMCLMRFCIHVRFQFMLPSQQIYSSYADFKHLSTPPTDTHKNWLRKAFLLWL